MTTPKVNTIKRQGARLYIHPDTGEQMPGVTSILNMLPKEFLKFWAAKMSAEFAVDMTPEWIGLVMKGERQAAVDIIKKAHMRNTGNAADMGTAAHDVFEKMSRDQKVGRVSPGLKPFVTHYQRFLDKFQPEFLHLEETVWQRSVGYAGSFDAIAIIEGETVILDNKTTRSGVHDEVCLQLNAYGGADALVDPDTGEETPLPDITGAAVVHMRPDEWGFYPVAYDPDKFIPVLGALKVVWDWEKNLRKGAIGRPIHHDEGDEDSD